MLQVRTKPGNDTEYAAQACDFLRSATYSQSLRVYNTTLNDPGLSDYVVAEFGRRDRFFLLAQVLGVAQMFHPWLYERCREVEADPDGWLDLWAREHFKSTIVTFGGSIQEIVNNPEITIGILSFNSKIARDFVSRIKRECESNQNLFRYYPEIFYQNPKKDSPSWSRDGGLIVKRKGNPNEATISGWGLVDAQPTSKHFGLMIYDDVVTEKSVTPEMTPKTTESWELSRHLSKRSDDGRLPRTWHVGTRYSFSDTYKTIMDRGVIKTRLYPATDDGTMDGKPVLLTQEEWDRKKQESSIYTMSCQMLQNPIAGSEAEFQEGWIRFYEVRPERLNVALLVDPAGSKSGGTSNTAFAVIGMDYARNKYLLDGACHKMSLNDKWLMLKSLWKKWINQPGIQSVKVGYEKYAHQSDIEHYETMMKIENFYIPIEQVGWVRDGEQSKNDRIRRLTPDHQNWRFFYPHKGEDETKLQRDTKATGKGYLIAKKIKRKDHNSKVYDLFEYLMTNEYLFFPATTKKDLLDAMSRFYDLGINPPMVVKEADCIPQFAGEL